MIIYTDLENELTARLNGYFAANNLPAFIAIPAPQNESELRRNIQTSRVWVGYEGSNYGPANSMETVVQDESIMIRLVYDARSLREADGLYSLIYHCKNSLLGYQPAGCHEKIWLGKFEKISYENLGIFDSQIIHTATPNIGIKPTETILGEQFKYATSIIPI